MKAIIYSKHYLVPVDWDHLPYIPRIGEKIKYTDNTTYTVYDIVWDNEFETVEIYVK